MKEQATGRLDGLELVLPCLGALAGAFVGWYTGDPEEWGDISGTVNGAVAGIALGILGMPGLKRLLDWRQQPSQHRPFKSHSGDEPWTKTT
jgi:hypothetical protein